MLNVLRNVSMGKSISIRTGILSMKIGEIISTKKCLYSTNARSSTTTERSNLKNDENVNKTGRKNLFSPKITVISNDSKLTVMTLEEAQKLSKRRDLKLVKVVDIDHKTQRPVYKLMTGAEYFQEDLIRRKEKSLNKNKEAKDPKLLTLSSNIGDHDLTSKIKNIIRWLNKRHEVRIVINVGGNEEAAEVIAKTIETETKHCGKMVQKRKKGNDIKFQLLTLKKSDDNSDEKSSAGENDAVKSDTES